MRPALADLLVLFAAASVGAGCGAGRTVVPASSAIAPSTDAAPSAAGSPVASDALVTAEPPPAAEPSATTDRPADFDGAVRPILEGRCQPCHFPGGKMHDRLPFDDPATIRDLGTRLFTRIEDPADQAVIRSFLGLPAE